MGFAALNPSYKLLKVERRLVITEETMARIVHIALKVEDLEKATKFYEDVFGIYQIKTGYARGHTSRHMTEGTIDLALMTYDSEDEPEAKLSGPGPCIHHFGIEVEDRDAMSGAIEQIGRASCRKECSGRGSREHHDNKEAAKPRRVH